MPVQPTRIQEMMGRVSQRQQGTEFLAADRNVTQHWAFADQLQRFFWHQEIVQIGLHKSKNLRGSKGRQRWKSRQLEETIEKEYARAKLFYQKLLKLITANSFWLLIHESTTMLCHLIPLTNLWIGFIISIFQIKKLRHNEVQQFVQSHTVSVNTFIQLQKTQSWFWIYTLNHHYQKIPKQHTFKIITFRALWLQVNSNELFF